jgi:hypothetical protein
LPTISIISLNDSFCSASVPVSGVEDGVTFEERETGVGVEVAEAEVSGGTDFGEGV